MFSWSVPLVLLLLTCSTDASPKSYRLPNWLTPRSGVLKPFHQIKRLTSNEEPSTRSIPFVDLLERRLPAQSTDLTDAENIRRAFQGLQLPQTRAHVPRDEFKKLITEPWRRNDELQPVGYTEYPLNFEDGGRSKEPINPGLDLADLVTLREQTNLRHIEPVEILSPTYSGVSLPEEEFYDADDAQNPIPVTKLANHVNAIQEPKRRSNMTMNPALLAVRRQRFPTRQTRPSEVSKSSAIVPISQSPFLKRAWRRGSQDKPDLYLIGGALGR